MKLQEISYSEFRGGPNAWVLDGLSLGKINLLVGRNASGKTRALNVINGLANMLAGRLKLQFRSGNYETLFRHDGRLLRYELEYRDAVVLRERFLRDGEVLLDRKGVGGGTIFAEKEKKNIEFQTPENELAAAARQDSVQHSFLEPLKQWGDSVFHFAFGEKLGKDRFTVFLKDPAGRGAFDPKDTTQVVGVYKKGVKDFGDSFKRCVTTDMESLGYALDEIEVAAPVSISVATPFPGEAVGLNVRERDLDGVTDQNDMSQGMFRALSVIIQVNYLSMSGKAGCMLIDDIGEGLDFERSCALIEVLMAKAEKSAFQLVMSTNDRFVMNKVPLETWALLERRGGQCRIHNYANSKEAFDEFKFTGMSNFDFFAVDFIHAEPAVNE